MRTDELIAGISSAPPRRLFGPTTAIVASAAASAVVVASLSFGWLGARDDLWTALTAGNRILLFKLVFTAGIVAAALSLVRDFSVPGRRPGLRPLCAVFALGVASALLLHGVGHATAIVGSHHGGRDSWIECLWKIPVLATPALLLLGIGVRYLAPTRLALAGAVTGLAAGGIGAVGYAFHCHDDSVALVLASYTLAISETTLIGLLAGPILLHWTSGSFGKSAVS